MFCKTGAWLPPVQREPFGRARVSNDLPRTEASPTLGRAANGLLTEADGLRMGGLAWAYEPSESQFLWERGPSATRVPSATGQLQGVGRDVRRT